MQWIDGIPVFCTPDPGAVSQITTCAKKTAWCALMADHHKGYAVPIGGVVAYQNAISPSGVGYDVGCGNKAVLTDMRGNDLRMSIKPIMDDIWNTISFGIGRKNNERVDHPLFESDAWKQSAVKDLKYLAEDQLGTVGSGNHYVDLFTDEQDRVIVRVYFQFHSKPRIELVAPPTRVQDLPLRQNIMPSGLRRRKYVRAALRRIVY